MTTLFSIKYIYSYALTGSKIILNFETSKCLLTILPHQNWCAMASGLYVDHNTGILLGKVHQVVFDEVAAEFINVLLNSNITF